MSSSGAGPGYPTTGEAARFRRKLRRELDARGLLAGPSARRAVRAEVQARGRRADAAIGSTVGERLWRTGLGSFHRPVDRKELERILGYGDLLTEYLTAGSGVRTGIGRRLARLGALANLLVTLYDRWMDAPEAGRAPFSRLELTGAIRGRGLLLRLRGRVDPRPAARLQARLVARYLAELEALCAAGLRPPRELLGRCILAMHRAEHESAAGGETPRASTLRRKSALPFVVMSLPAVPARDGGGTTPAGRARLRWAYRLGLYLGWIDDAADLEEDVAGGHPNRVARRLAGVESGEQRRLAEAVAELGVRVRTGWPGSADESPDAVERVLAGVVRSWLGSAGVGPEASSEKHPSYLNRERKYA